MKSSCIILCGGRGERVGGIDKGWLEYRGRPLVVQVLERLESQVDEIIVSANRNLARYRDLGHRVVSDRLADFQGPLAGVAAALPFCQHEACVIVACDMPMLPGDLVARLLTGLSTHRACCAWDGSRDQHLAAAMQRQVRGSLDDYLQRGGRSVRGWFQQIGCHRVDFSDCPDCFINVNRLE